MVDARIAKEWSSQQSGYDPG